MGHNRTGSHAIGVVQDQVCVNRLTIDHLVGNTLRTEVIVHMTFVAVSPVQQAGSSLNILAGGGDSDHALVGTGAVNLPHLDDSILITGGIGAGLQVELGFDFDTGIAPDTHAGTCPAEGRTGIAVTHLGADRLVAGSHHVGVQQTLGIPVVHGLQVLFVVLLGCAVVGLSILAYIKTAFRIISVSKGVVVGQGTHRPFIAERGGCALFFLKGSQHGVPLVNSGGDFQAELIKPVLPDEQSLRDTQFLIAADERECIVVAVIGAALAGNFGVGVQVGFQVRAVLVDDVIQRDDNTVGDCLFRTAGVVLPVIFHNIRQITISNQQVELLILAACWRVKEGDVYAGVLHQPLAKGAFAHVLIIGADVLVQVTPVGDAMTCGHRVGELICVAALCSGRGTAGGLGRGGCRAFGAAAAACQHCGGQGCRSGQRGGLLDFFHVGVPPSSLCLWSFSLIERGPAAEVLWR